MTRRGFLGSAAAAAAPAIRARERQSGISFSSSATTTATTSWAARAIRGSRRRPWTAWRAAACFSATPSSPRRCARRAAPRILTRALYPRARRHGQRDARCPPDLTTFPEILQKHGYRTGFIGKWHMGGEGDDARPGFDRWVSFRGQGQYDDPLINFDGDRRKTKGYVSDILTDEALRFIGQNAATAVLPLPLAQERAQSQRQRAAAQDALPERADSVSQVHGRYRGELPRQARLGAPPAQGHARRGRHVQQRDRLRPVLPPVLPHRRPRSTRASGACSNELEEKRLLNDTLVVYMSDNGFLIGDHGLIDKRCMYEPSIRVPMLAHCPDMFAGGGRPEGMALNIDIAPTMLEAAGAPRPANLHGRSLLPLLRGGDTPGARSSSTSTSGSATTRTRPPSPACAPTVQLHALPRRLGPGRTLRRARRTPTR